MIFSMAPTRLKNTESEPGSAGREEMERPRGMDGWMDEGGERCRREGCNAKRGGNRFGGRKTGRLRREFHSATVWETEGRARDYCLLESSDLGLCHEYQRPKQPPRHPLSFPLLPTPSCGASPARQLTLTKSTYDYPHRTRNTPEDQRGADAPFEDFLAMSLQQLKINNPTWPPRGR